MIKTIYLAGGCFWGVERFFSLAKGIVSTKVGYANGTLDNPRYEDLKRGFDDASETVKIEYDTSLISLEKIRELYLRMIDPYSLNKQGEDEGIQYRTGVYFIDMEDASIINRYLNQHLNPGFQVEILPLNKFFDAEEYHQKYLEKNPNGYCHVNMAKLNEDERK